MYQRIERAIGLSATDEGTDGVHCQGEGKHFERERKQEIILGPYTQMSAELHL